MDWSLIFNTYAESGEEKEKYEIIVVFVFIAEAPSGWRSGIIAGCAASWACSFGSSPG